MDSFDDGTLRRVVDALRRLDGADIGQYRGPTLRRQIARCLAEAGSPDVDHYLQRLETDAEEVRRLRRCVLISVTSFFRDAAAFEVLGQALQRRLEQDAQGRDLRLWVAGCATGEEAYSLAIVVLQALQRLGRQVPVRIFATDTDGEAVAVARAGLYPPEALEGLPAELTRYFRAVNGQVTPVDAVRDLCVFAEHDLIAQVGFVNLDLISCRNVLIYFEPAARAAVLRRFHHGLRPGGHLLLGQSESIAADDAGFARVVPNVPLYTSAGRAPVAVDRHLLPAQADGWREQPPGPRPASTIEQRLQAHLLERSRLACLAIDAAGQVRHTWGPTAAYLRPDPSSDLTLETLIAPELRQEARTLVQLAQTTPGTEVHGTPLPLAGGPAAGWVRLGACTLGDAGGEPLVVLVIEAVPAPAGGTADALQADLLQVTREQLHTLSQQFQRSEAFRRDAVESLQISNEELQSTNEELQASNEELRSLNEALSAKTDEMAELNELLLSIESSVNTSIIVLDRHLRIRRYNSPAVRIFGLLPTDVGRPLSLVPATLDLGSLFQALGPVLREGQSHLAPIDQGERHYMARIDPLRDAHRGVVGLVLSFSDVAELRRAEIERARLAAIVEGSDDAIIGKSLEGIVSSWNPGAERLFGRSAAQMVGRPMVELFPPSLRHQERELLARVAAGESVPSFDTERLHDSGRVLAVSVALSPIRDTQGRVVGVSTIARDIADRKRREAALDASHAQLQDLVAQRTRQLAASEAQFRGIVESLSGHVCHWSADLQPLATNEAFGAVLAALDGPDAVLHRLAQALHPGRNPALHDAALVALRGAVTDFEIDLADDSGAPLHYKVCLQPVMAGSAVNGFVVQAFDVTPLHQARLAEARANRSKSDFLASISHEIRTPLNAVLGLSQVGQRRAREADDVQLFTRILHAGEHLLGVINDVLDLSRIEAGKVELHAAPMSVAAVVERVVDILGDEARRKSLRLVVDVAPDLPPAYLGDEVRVAQLLINLLANAVKFTRFGEVGLAARAEDGMLRFDIWDTGPGIDQGMLGRLFQPFERARSAHGQEPNPGSGLGLAICKRLCDLMAGSVEVLASTASGSHFLVRLPLPVAAAQPGKAPAAAPATARPASAGRRLAGLHVLVAEDNPVNMMVITALLDIEGARHSTAEDGEAAVEAVRQSLAGPGPRFDVVLCDIEMPRLDGYGVARAVARMPQAPPVVGLTAHAFGEAQRQAQEAGMVGYVTKPVLLDQLVDSLRSVCPPRPAAGG